MDYNKLQRLPARAVVDIIFFLLILTLFLLIPLILI